MRRHSLARALILLAALAPAARAGERPPMNMAALRDQSPLIVIGCVSAAGAVEARPGLSEQVSVIHIASVLRGTYGPRLLRVRTRAGLLFFDTHLERGEAGVFFLKPLQPGVFELAVPGGFARFQEGTFDARCLPAPTGG